MFAYRVAQQLNTVVGPLSKRCMSSVDHTSSGMYKWKGSVEPHKFGKAFVALVLGVVGFKVVGLSYGHYVDSAKLPKHEVDYNRIWQYPMWNIGRYLPLVDHTEFAEREDMQVMPAFSNRKVWKGSNQIEDQVVQPFRAVMYNFTCLVLYPFKFVCNSIGSEAYQSFMESYGLLPEFKGEFFRHRLLWREYYIPKTVRRVSYEMIDEEASQRTEAMKKVVYEDTKFAFIHDAEKMAQRKEILQNFAKETHERLNKEEKEQSNKKADPSSIYEWPERKMAI